MKRILLFCLLFIIVSSCKKEASPKETAQAFIKAVYAVDLSTASTLASRDTKATLNQTRRQIKNTLLPDESFHFSSLTETISDKKAEVKNDIVAISLVKESDGWKVHSDEKLLNDIIDREELLATVKTKWENLLKEYEARLDVLKEYIDYKKGIGSLSPKAGQLSKEVNSFSKENNWTNENLLTYVRKQQQLDKVIDEALEPSLAANTDLSLNYFLQISNAGDRIKQAEEEYQVAAERAHSSVYVPLPFNVINSLKVNSN